MIYQWNPDRISALMEARNQTEAEFAEMAGVARQVVWRWKRGEQAPSIATLALICSRANVPPSFFFAATEDLPPGPDRKKEGCVTVPLPAGYDKEPVGAES